MRLRREEGQTFVLTVLFMVAILGAAALVLDVGSWFREKRQLQATADAAALAGAQALPDDPGNAVTLALKYANENGGGVTANDVTVSSSLTTDDTITVNASSNAPGFFSKLFGIVKVDVGASAAARSAVPTQALHVAPMVVSEQHPLLKGCNPGPCSTQQTTLDYDPMGAPGAFGMLNLENGGGTPGSSDEADWISRGFDKYLPLGFYRSDPGAKFTSQQVGGALDFRRNTILLFPVFRTLAGTGQNAKYLIIGWVGFYLDSYRAQGNNATLTGHFTRFVAEGVQSGSGTNQPDFGVRSVQLIH
jgi:hypothetical protein